LCRRHGAFLLVDAAQGVGLLDHDVERDGADALAITGHKSLLGPQGTGALYLREPERVEPLVRGGTGSRSEEETQPGFPPDRFEAGTLNVPGLAGLAAGVRYVRAAGPAALRDRVRERTARLDEGVRNLPGVTVLGPADPTDRVGIVALTVTGRTTSDVARHLERDGILCRPGLQCAPRAHRTLGTLPQGAVRLSVSASTLPEEIDAAVDSLAGLTGGG
jgi:selenocysteine lyase/cysteine desulfurase